MIGVIDVGSNSVRLLLSDDDYSEKFIKVTKLAEGLNSSGMLNKFAMKRTADAVAFFKNYAIEHGAKEVLVFATEAVRSASNKKAFIELLKTQCELVVDVISGEKEAEIGLLGVLDDMDGGIIDIGGASSEITTRIGKKVVYSHSLKLGGVRLLDACGQNLNKLRDLCGEKVIEYGSIPSSTYYGIGGTATSIASVVQGLKVYDKDKVHGYKLTKKDVVWAIELFNSKTVEERKNIVGLQPERADVILGASVLLLTIMEKIGLEYIIVSESDNLEGYLYSKKVKNEQ